MYIVPVYCAWAHRRPSSPASRPTPSRLNTVPVPTPERITPLTHPPTPTTRAHARNPPPHPHHHLRPPSPLTSSSGASLLTAGSQARGHLYGSPLGRRGWPSSMYSGQNLVQRPNATWGCRVWGGVRGGVRDEGGEVAVRVGHAGRGERVEGW